MPFVTISASQSFSAEQKRRLVTEASDAVLANIDATALPRTRVLLQEIADGHYLCGGEFGLPVVMYWVELLEGRSDDAKLALAAALRQSGVQVSGLADGDVKVRIVDRSRVDMGMAPA